jgi:hypothetical protein
MRHDNSSINLPNGSWLVLPRRIYAPAAIGARFVVLPLIAVAANVDWPHFWSLTTRKSSTTALVLSQTAGASTPLCLPFGVPMALVLARDGRSAVLMSHDLLDVHPRRPGARARDWADHRNRSRFGEPGRRHRRTLMA